CAEPLARQRRGPRTDEDPGPASLPIHPPGEQVIRLIELDLAAERRREGAGALRHVEHEVVELAVGAPARTPLRELVGLLRAIEHQGDLVRKAGWMVPG